ncbi:phosphinothricin acetyltransferase [Nitrospirillum viridazoti]|nr:phosphinothricin acetyltransferase [Nitrospirillum amazonense]
MSAMTDSSMPVPGMNQDPGASQDLASPVPGTLPSPIVLRHSNDEDVPAMLDIYRHHIGHSVGNLGTFVPTPFDIEDLKARRKNMRKHKLPHLVATIDGVVLGYAYAVLFRKRPAYRFTVKHSIYIHPDRLHRGIGRALLPALIQECAAAGFRQMIGYVDSSNAASLRLHEACGFRQVGYLAAVAFRFDKWTDTVMLQRAIGPEGGQEDCTPP